MFRYDLHIHTYRSLDSNIKVDALIRKVEELGLAGVAITDHTNIKAALEIKEKAPFFVVVGREISTPEGDLLAYFVKKDFPVRMQAEDAIAHARNQGALIGAAHPFTSVYPPGMPKESLLNYVDRLDFIEGLNAEEFDVDRQNEIQSIATRSSTPMTAGSDAHFLREIGGGHIQTKIDIRDKETFLKAISRCHLIGRKLSRKYALKAFLTAWAKSIGLYQRNWKR